MLILARMMMASALCPDSRCVVGHKLRLVASVVALALLAACATRRPAPIEDRTAQPMRPLPGVVAPPPAAAVTPVAPEPDWRPPTYTVKRGDTLHAIALDYGLDYRDLAAWNSIDNANLIIVGQVLRLSPPGEPGSAMLTGPSGVTTAPLRSVPGVVAQTSPTPSAPAPAGARNTDNYKAQPRLFKEPYSDQALREAQRIAAAPSQPAAAAPSPPSPPPAAATTPPPPAAKSEPRSEARAPTAPAEGDDRLQWSWPASGKVIAGFSETANLKGIDIGGSAGTPVVASAAGKVVYAGSGLRGYGKLIIVKHNPTFLSAYAHNREILVKEGQQVTRGQKIAEMGNSDASDVKLHFEIRRLGKPVDPLKYLPPA